MENTINWKQFYSNCLKDAEDNVKHYSEMIALSNKTLQHFRSAMKHAFDLDYYEFARKCYNDEIKNRARYYWYRKKALAQVDDYKTILAEMD